MQTSIWTSPLEIFCQDISSSEPTPGGGAVSMVAATFGVSLVEMAVNVTLNKNEEQSLRLAVSQLSSIRQQLIELADDDISTFRNFMAALQKPKSNETLAEQRKVALASCALQASMVPLAACDAVIAALAIAKEIRPAVTKLIVSDVDAGEYLLRAAGCAVLLNVDANLAWLEPEDRKTIVARTVASRNSLTQK
ncbi:cyclodeaminase/cyclohydrolase family protein [Rhizobium leguminosarum]|uniref:cyclodeaminase/cyclohydrolase family protein n=1 Tax=Rhizobium leguminosarum TaxID=384 RepID=UPI00162031B8|nr:cyclodeaminase/cyclohydrolase family protein [Rhizobium leguminosarum]MBB4342990.1 formiminotetrahydrofolate cyclodeaminase [Rhizobium leguminosarum]MBB6296068.1 formiminotetrahydrofolate cyclodeaminase [Rhizobium leguminosarum]